jgi:hypothetical protein
MIILKKLYDKSKIWFAVSWIIAYCVLLSVGDALSAEIGIIIAVLIWYITKKIIKIKGIT